MPPCTCTNPKCPGARQFNACHHCMCLTQPDFGPNAAISYSGPISQVCCKCGYAVQIGGTAYPNTIGTTTATAR